MIQQRTEASGKAKQDGSFLRCISQIDEAISLLIDRTEDVDAFITYPGEPKKQSFQTLYRGEYGTLRAKRPEDYRQGVTVLGLAGEADDSETCRKLLLAGADATKAIGLVKNFCDNQGNNVLTPNSFVFRLISYSSWNTLRMFLTEFKDRAETVMHKGKFAITPLVAFIIKAKDEFQKTGTFNERMTNWAEVEYFISLFINAGASMTEETQVSCAAQLLGR